MSREHQNSNPPRALPAELEPGGTCLPIAIVSSRAPSGSKLSRTADGSCSLCHGTGHFYVYGAGPARDCHVCANLRNARAL